MDKYRNKTCRDTPDRMTTGDRGVNKISSVLEGPTKENIQADVMECIGKKE